MGQNRTAALALVISFCLLVPKLARADDVVQSIRTHPATTALGLMIGEPAALSFKHWHSRNAWDVGLGVGPGVRIHGDYLLTLAQWLSGQSTTALDIYVGLGPVIGVRTGWCGSLYDTGLSCGDGGIFVGGRMPVGLDLRLPIPLDLAIEAAPGVFVAKQGALFFLIDAAIYARILF